MGLVEIAKKFAAEIFLTCGIGFGAIGFNALYDLTYQSPAVKAATRIKFLEDELKKVTLYDLAALEGKVKMLYIEKVNELSYLRSNPVMVLSFKDIEKKSTIAGVSFAFSLYSFLNCFYAYLLSRRKGKENESDITDLSRNPPKF
ncbi:MAG: hypothetical protein QXK64_00940 [Candidatus Woesearchaeota archaeon]